jgi:hypothetical protein
LTDCNDLARVVVDTTVQPKAVMFPTDAKLVNRARERLVRLAKKLGVTCLAFIKPKPKFRNLSFCESGRTEYNAFRLLTLRISSEYRH